MKTIQDIDLSGKRVILRADYNVPLDGDKITDDYRIRQSLETVQYLLKQGCQIVIISHLGRPDGAPEPKYSLRPVAEHLEELIKRPVALVDTIEEVKASDETLTMLENLRFWPGEEANDAEFAKGLASLGEIFVQDGFGVVHRAHASTAAITEYLPSVAGLLLAREVEVITRAMENPQRPLVAIFGGAKISDKIQVIERFIDRADRILIGGAMANTFLAYAGYNVGKSVHETGQDATIERLLHRVLKKEDSDCKACQELTDHKELLDAQQTIELPEDVVIAEAVEKNAQGRIVETGDVSDNDYILDLGPKTISKYQSVIENAATVIWNGPVGYTELSQFAEGSNELAATLKARKGEVESIIGGGDTAGFILHWDLGSGASFSHISTGGGAALDLMSGMTLPGLAALEE